MKGQRMQFNQICDKTKKSYCSHMNENVEKNTIQMCYKIRDSSQ